MFPVKSDSGSLKDHDLSNSLVKAKKLLLFMELLQYVIK